MTATETDVLLSRSALCEALALGFGHPAPGGLTRLLSAEGNAALADLAGCFSSGLAEKVRALPLAADAGDPERLAAAHRRLFGHTAHPAAPPYETEYGSENVFQKPYALADVSGFYAAFGLQRGANVFERHDHVSCEFEFLSFVYRKAALDFEEGRPEEGESTLGAAKLFLRDHLARFAPAFCALVLKSDPSGFYGRLAGLCAEFLGLECGRWGVSLGPEELKLYPAEPDEGCLSCGGAEAFIPGPANVHEGRGCR